MALSTRLRMAVTSSSWSPQTAQSSPVHEGDLDVACPRRRAGDRSTASRAARGQVDEVRVAEGGGDLQPGQVDDLLDQPGQPDGLDLHPLGEPGHGLGVVVRVEDGLGQQREAADRGLQLVADVGDEVAPDLLEPAGLGAVVDEQQHVRRARAARPGRRRRGRARPAGPWAAPARPRGSRRRAAPAGPARAARAGRGRCRGPARRRPRRGVVDDRVGRVEDDRRWSAARRGRRRRRRAARTGRPSAPAPGAAARSERRTAYTAMRRQGRCRRSHRAWQRSSRPPLQGRSRRASSPDRGPSAARSR